MFGLQNFNMEKIVTPRLDLPLLQFPRSRKPTLIPSPSLNRYVRLKQRGFETEIYAETESHGVKMSNTVGRKLLGLAAAAAVAVSSSICCDSPALAESITIAFPVSRAREVIKFLLLIPKLQSTLFFNVSVLDVLLR